jgi:hypothetical protein
VSLRKSAGSQGTQGTPPTADDLAGTPVSNDQRPVTNGVRGSAAKQRRTRGVKTTARSLPTPDDLAGIPVSAGDEGDANARSRKKR